MNRSAGWIAVAAALVVAVVAFVLVAPRSVATPSPSPSPTLTITTPTATSTVTPTVAATPASASGSIAGLFRYPAGFVPALTTYAVSAADSRVFFSVATPRSPAVVGATPSPGPGPSYTINGIAPGTYFVFSYRDSDFGAPPDKPGMYSKWWLCARPTSSAQPVNPTPSTCTDHSLAPVTVRAGETVSGIDVADWTYNSDPNVPYPPRPAR